MFEEVTKWPVSDKNCYLTTRRVSELILLRTAAAYVSTQDGVHFEFS